MARDPGIAAQIGAMLDEMARLALLWEEQWLATLAELEVQASL